MAHARFITVDEIAEYLRIPKPTVYFMAQKGEIPAFKIGRHWRFEKEVFDAWVEKQKNRAYLKAQKKKE
ncbi:MAG: helix-turn-helix domain-containing protein [Candidatus Omnitrophota bacterium]